MPVGKKGGVWEHKSVNPVHPTKKGGSLVKKKMRRPFLPRTGKKVGGFPSPFLRSPEGKKEGRGPHEKKFFPPPPKRSTLGKRKIKREVVISIGERERVGSNNHPD